MRNSIKYVIIICISGCTRPDLTPPPTPSPCYMDDDQVWTLSELGLYHNSSNAPTLFMYDHQYIPLQGGLTEVMDENFNADVDNAYIKVSTIGNECNGSLSKTYPNLANNGNGDYAQSVIYNAPGPDDAWLCSIAIEIRSSLYDNKVCYWKMDFHDITYNGSVFLAGHVDGMWSYLSKWDYSNTVRKIYVYDQFNLYTYIP